MRKVKFIVLCSLMMVALSAGIASADDSKVYDVREAQAGTGGILDSDYVEMRKIPASVPSCVYDVREPQPWTKTILDGDYVEMRKIPSSVPSYVYDVRDGRPYEEIMLDSEGVKIENSKMNVPIEVHLNPWQGVRLAPSMYVTGGFIFDVFSVEPAGSQIKIGFYNLNTGDSYVAWATSDTQYDFDIPQGTYEILIENHTADYVSLYGYVMPLDSVRDHEPTTAVSGNF